jgi:hypothetical protein
MTKPKLYLHVGQATHFLRWERPHFARHFELVEQPSTAALLLAFGPDVLASATELPCRKRIALLFPGFGFNPYHDRTYRAAAREQLQSSYDLLLINPGALEAAYGDLPFARLCPFSIDDSLVGFRRYRKRLRSLLHVSAKTPQKDRTRSLAVMSESRLAHEIFPSERPSLMEELQERFLARLQRSRLAFLRPVPSGYAYHTTVIKKYHAHDGFVHCAGDIAHPAYLDGKYTACLMEAGATGAILFWHDTFSLGNDLECVFSLPLDPKDAGAKIRSIARDLDVEKHSRMTRNEILDRFAAVRSVATRAHLIMDVLDTPENQHV